MTAQREHEMLFKLGAQLNSNFNGTFRSAQQVLTATQKKVQEFNKLQADIGAYQRQQAGIDKSNQKLEMYKSQLANTQRALDAVRKEIEKNGSASVELAAKEAELANKEIALRNRIRDTENSIADKNNRLRQMGQELEKAGVDTNNLASETQRLEREMAELRTQEEQASNEAANFGNSASEAFEAVGSALQAAGIITGLKKIYDAYKECVGISMEFESTMSTVEALSGANALEMQSLTDKAKELGATTVFTANQSAEAMTFMGMAGWDAAEMLSGMNGVMSLAAASGEDLGLVSDIITDNLTAFGLKAKDTAHFSDVLAAAATNSNTSVSIMGETFSGSASIAGALGYSIEDVATAVGLMANAGVKGSVAGTALKNTFNGLLNGATLTGKVLGEVEYTAINADGTMKEFADTIDELRGYFDKMTEAERVQNAMVLAGQRGYNGLLAILNATDEDYQSLSDSINNCTGAAQRMADIKLDNLQGDVTLLQSAADGLKTSVGELYRDELRQLAQIGTEILSGIQQFVQENPAVAKAILTVVGGIGAVVAGYSAFAAVKKTINAVQKISTALTAANTAAVTAEGVAANTAAKAHMARNLAIAGVTVVLVAAIAAWREASKTATLTEQTLSAATNEQTAEVERLNSEYSAACEKYGEMDDRARALKYDLDEATSAIENQSFSVSALYAEIDSLHDSTADLLSVYNDASYGLDEQQESAHVLAAKLKEIAGSSENAAAKQELLAPIVSKLNKLYPSLGLTVDNVTNKIDGLSAAIDNAAQGESLQTRYDAAKESLADLYEQQIKLQEAQRKAEIAYDKAGEKLKNTTGNGNYFVALVGSINGAATAAQKDTQEALDKLTTANQDLAAVNSQIRECEDVLEEYGVTISGTGDEATSVYNAMSIAISNVSEETQNLVAAYNDAYNAAYDSVSGQYALWDNAASVVPVSVGTINSALSSQADYWEKYNENLETLSERSKDIEGLSDIIAGFADGSESSVNAVAGMAKASDKELETMVENYKKLKEQQEKASQSLADVKTDFENQMDEIARKMEDTVEDMNLNDEAAAAAKATIDAYAEAIAAGSGKAVQSAEDLVEAVRTKLLNGLIHDGSPEILVTPGENGGPDMVHYYGAGAKYASGTDYAAQGVALVGEEGPELVYMRGGERVVDAENTRALLGGSNTITVSPKFIINNNGGEIDEEQVSALSERLIESVMDALDEAGINRRRMAYV